MFCSWINFQGPRGVRQGWIQVLPLGWQSPASPGSVLLTQAVLFSGRVRMRGGKWSRQHPPPPAPTDIVSFSPQNPKAAVIGHVEPLDTSEPILGVARLSWAGWGPMATPQPGARQPEAESRGRVSLNGQQGLLPKT